MRILCSLAATFLVVSLAPAAVFAQSSLPPVGTHAVTFTLLEGGGAGFGIRKMRSATTNLGVEVEVGASRQWSDASSNSGSQPQDRSSWSLGVRPDVRLYRRTEGPVLPFLEWSGRVAYRGASGGHWIVDGTLGVGLGVEWFPLKGMSISGSTGLAGTYSRRSDTDAAWNALTLGAFRSNLMLNLYF